MDALSIKERLHEYIETADNEHLAAIYVLLEKEITPSHSYSPEVLQVLYQRVDDDLKGISESHTIEEAFAFARNAKK